MNEKPEILQTKLKGEGITNILRFDQVMTRKNGDLASYLVQTAFENDLVIEARLKDDKEVAKAVVEIIDTKTGEVIGKKELKVGMERNGRKTLTTGDIGYHEDNLTLYLKDRLIRRVAKKEEA